MKTKLSIITSILLGVIFGALSNYSILRGSWHNIIVWGIVGILIGLFIYNKKYIKQAGLLYGFSLAVTFLISGFKGTSDKLPGFILMVIVFAILSALCGWAAVFVGNWLKGGWKR
jgi:hypothetical protein